MARNSFITEYLTFSKKERIGLLVVTFCAFSIFILPNIFPSKPKRLAPDKEWLAAVAKLQIKRTAVKDRNDQRQDDISEISYKKTAGLRPNYKPDPFYFDPNTIAAEGWKKLGLPERTIATINKYLGKGGYFDRPEDLKKIYGLHQDDYDRLVPYVRINSRSKPTDKEFPAHTGSNGFAKSKTFVLPVDVNTADTTALIALPGIGGKLAARIINFRDRLGGFYSIEQVGETYGIADSSFQKMKQFLLLAGTVKKINLNSVTKDELKTHPYFRWNLANAIVSYRDQHGNFTSVEELQHIALITDVIFKKIKPYLEL